METINKIDKLINQAWEIYIGKVSNNLLEPENEKVMQLQLAQILQTLTPLYEFTKDESIKVTLEEPKNIKNDIRRIIDIVIKHSIDNHLYSYPIELKCFRKYVRGSDTKKRGAQNIGMYDYWEDIENIEQYLKLENYIKSYHLAITDDEYYVRGSHKGEQTSVYSTNENITKTGVLEAKIANRYGRVELSNSYTCHWKQENNYFFLLQKCEGV